MTETGSRTAPAPGGLMIRDIEDVDLDVVVAIEAAVNPQPWTRTLFVEELALPPASRHWLVATMPDGPGRRIVGYAGMMYAPDAAHLMLIGVEPSVGRRGIATTLCLGLFAEARRREADGVTLEVRASNEPAIRLYRSLGMTIGGSRPKYYPDGEDAVIWWLDDLNEPSLVALHSRLSAGTTGDGR